jgi:hypothetical protein
MFSICLDELHRNNEARPQSKLRMRTRICLFLSVAVQAELPSGGYAAANRSPPLLLAGFFHKNLGEIPSNFDLKNVNFRL